MYEEIQEYIYDMTEQGVYSNCCGANIIFGDICTECKEHCEPSDEDED